MTFVTAELGVGDSSSAGMSLPRVWAGWPLQAVPGVPVRWPAYMSCCVVCRGSSIHLRVSVSCYLSRLGNLEDFCPSDFFLASSLSPSLSQILIMSNTSIDPRNPLLVPDLFFCVLEYLVTSLPLERPSKEERQILAVLARTCRAFSEPSLDRLWRCLNSLLPLIRSFAVVVDDARVKVVIDHLPE